MQYLVLGVVAPKFLCEELMKLFQQLLVAPAALGLFTSGANAVEQNIFIERTRDFGNSQQSQNKQRKNYPINKVDTTESTIYLL